MIVLDLTRIIELELTLKVNVLVITKYTAIVNQKRGKLWRQINHCRSVCREVSYCVTVTRKVLDA